MSASPMQSQGVSDAESHRGASYFPSINTSKDRLLEQKRAEHEYARQQHRRRFEEQMQILESKQQRDEAILNGVDEDPRTVGTLPVTPVRTPGHVDARSRASTITKPTPPLKVFESRVTLNDQLATPPSDHPRASPSAFVAARSVPGSRRTSTSLGFESLTLSDHSEQRRVSYIDPSRPFAQQEPHRLSIAKMYPEEGPSSSYLQMNTTDDSFPILVRKDSYAAGLTPAVNGDFASESRKPGHATTPSSFISHGRTSQVNPQAHHGMLEDLELAHNRPVPDFSLPSGQKSFAGGRNSAFDSESARRAFTTMSNSGGRSPLGALPSMAANMHSPSQSPALFNHYNILPTANYQNFGFPPLPTYGVNQHHISQMNSQDPSRSQNPYAIGRAGNYTKRPTEDLNRYADVALESLIGDIYSLCKDQHGCRYLQKKLDERNAANVELIFSETYSHAAELMIDPFGNYLCQKLLEHCDDQKRLKIVESVAADLVNISLNMHGTRAVQKMIEYLTTPEQIRIATDALNTNAVTLIKDLNGNHVIQKCLNRLGSQENQFIFNAVSEHCIEVATHRHGCCVLQRCIDHASDKQKAQIIKEITHNAPLLVQDPFGNYVVQYVLDLGEPRFSDPLIKRFVGSVCLFSVQKFSSNVIEKCLRVAEPQTRMLLIEELLHKSRLEKLLRDSFANYVVQTALDYADSTQRQQLVDCIRPLLPAIRSTPYGRRIQSKISGNVTGPYNSSFNIGQQGPSFPGYGFQMPTPGPGLAHLTNYHKSFKGDYEY